MPIYEYQCNSCLRDFEELAFGDEKPVCPHCHSANTEKLLSRPCACRSGRHGEEASSSHGGGGCAGCSGGSCASCVV